MFNFVKQENQAEREDMKIDEDLGFDREDAFQTDDEENRAERVCVDDCGDDTESDYALASRNPSSNCLEVNNTTWPQSYRFLFVINSFWI